MNLLQHLQEKWSCPDLIAIEEWKTDQGEMGVYQDSKYHSISLVVAGQEQMVIQIYASIPSALEDVRCIAAFAGLQSPTGTWHTTLLENKDIIAGSWTPSVQLEHLD